MQEQVGSGGRQANEPIDGAGGPHPDVARHPVLLGVVLRVALADLQVPTAVGGSSRSKGTIDGGVTVLGRWQSLRCRHCISFPVLAQTNSSQKTRACVLGKNTRTAAPLGRTLGNISEGGSLPEKHCLCVPSRKGEWDKDCCAWDLKSKQE